MQNIICKLILDTTTSANEKLQNYIASDRSRSGLIGVTLHKRTQKYETHIWYNKKQIYIGSYADQVQAARAHDLVALKLKGTTTLLNFPLEDYAEIVPYIPDSSMQEIMTILKSISRSITLQVQTQKTLSTGRSGSSSYGSAAAGSSRKSTQNGEGHYVVWGGRPSEQQTSYKRSRMDYDALYIQGQPSHIKEENTKEATNGNSNENRSNSRSNKRKQSMPVSSLDVHSTVGAPPPRLAPSSFFVKRNTFHEEEGSYRLQDKAIKDGC